MPKVSVIIPTYNQAKFLSETIQSVLDQTFQDFEIIVIDDGSTDNTKEIASRFPVIYCYQENQGPAGARNRGIEMSQGKYVALLDSDDVLLEDALAISVKILDSHPEVSFSYGQAYRIDEHGRIYGIRKRPFKHSYIRDGAEEIGDLIYGNYIPTSMVMIRQSCFKEAGLFNTSFRSGSEDFDMWVRLAKKHAVSYIAEPLVKYRVHSGSISATRDFDERVSSNSLVLESVFNDAELGPLLSSQKLKVYFSLYLRMARRAYGNREMKTARAFLFKALKNRPRGFFKRTWPLWVFELSKTWLPLPLVRLAHYCKTRGKGTRLSEHDQ